MAYPQSGWKQQLAKGFLVTIWMTLLMNTASFSQEDPVDVLASAVRQQGYVCDHPKGAKPDPENTSPGEEAWILHCEEQAFKVKFMGDTGANVEPLSE